jgi:HD-like signal output (HDOD) protein
MPIGVKGAAVTPRPGVAVSHVQELPQSVPPTLAAWYQASSTNLPVLPDVATRVIDIAANPLATSAQLAEAISSDQVLTSRLLGVANSAHGLSTTSVTSIRDAVMRVGLTGVRNLAVAVCFASRLHDRRVYGEQGRQLVEHGLCTAYVARLVAVEAGLDGDEAFLCGLLHDIGKLVLLKWYYDHARRTSRITPADEVQAIVKAWHPGVATLMFRRSNLPPQLDEPVLYHHNFQQATENRPLAAVVYLANRLSHRWGFGCEPDGFDAREDAAAWELGLDPLWLETLDGRAPELRAAAEQVLGAA